MIRFGTLWGRARLCMMLSLSLCLVAGGTALADTVKSSDSPKVLVLDKDSVPVGASVTATAAGLPAGAAVTLIWKTVEGGWVIQDYYRFLGKKFTSVDRELARAVVAPDGTLKVGFSVPRDYGGVHEIAAVAAGKELATGGLEVVATFEMSRSEGPVGTMIEIRGNGLGWRTMESTWVLNWDNRAVGWLSAVDTQGSAVARFRATGPVGGHFIKIYSGYMGQSYLNFEQAPTAYLPRPEFVFRTTPGGTVPAAYAEPYLTQPGSSESTTGASVSITPAQGPVKTAARFKASGLPAGARVALVWETWVGSRVTEAGFASEEAVLQESTVRTDGTLDVPVSIPDDLGGRHFLVVRDGDRELARASFLVETSIVGISPASGPAGTMVTIHLKGVGWTEYDNIYVANYDNAYMGYACGFNSQGDVQVTFMAAGEPGVHLIDLYPSIYKGPLDGQQLYRLPQLTYSTDHPGNRIPALRFAFVVTAPK